MLNKSENTLIINFNLLGVFIALGMLTLSIWLTPVALATKGFWAIGVLMLSLAMVNFVKYRIEDRIREDRLNRLENARNEKLLEEYVTDRAA
jgi:hypothetical protein